MFPVVFPIEECCHSVSFPTRYSLVGLVTSPGRNPLLMRLHPAFAFALGRWPNGPGRWRQDRYQGCKGVEMVKRMGVLSILEWHSTPLHSTLPYPTLLYPTLPYPPPLYSTLLSSTLLYCTLFSPTLLYSIPPYSMLSYPGSPIPFWKFYSVLEVLFHKNRNRKRPKSKLSVMQQRTKDTQVAEIQHFNSGLVSQVSHCWGQGNGLAGNILPFLLHAWRVILDSFLTDLSLSGMLVTGLYGEPLPASPGFFFPLATHFPSLGCSQEFNTLTFSCLFEFTTPVCLHISLYIMAWEIRRGVDQT